MSKHIYSNQEHIEIIDVSTLTQIIQAKKNIKEQKGLVDCFCNMCKVNLSYIRIDKEEGVLEPVYYFSDNNGGYTIRGIQNSIKEKLN